jgi:S-DNA-T family DNA segregation ATPase FtsK/SpoIIIE
MAFSLAGIRALWPGASKRSVDADDSARKSDSVVGGSAPPDKNRKIEPEAMPRNARTYAREAGALLLIASGLYVALALASYEADPLRPEAHGPDWVGPAGAVIARVLVHAVGVVSWLVPLELMLLSLPLLADRKLKLRITRASGDVLVVVILAALTHIAFPRVRTFGEMPLGGFIGDLFGNVMRGLFSTVGSFLIGLTVVALILIERATFSFIEAMQRVRAWLAAAKQGANKSATAVAAAWARARVADRERRDAERRASEPLIVAPEQADDIIATFADQDETGGAFLPVAKPRTAAPPAEEEVETPSPIAPKPKAKGDDGATRLAAGPGDEIDTPSPTPAGPIDPKPAAAEAEKPSRKRAKKDDPVIVDTSVLTKTEKAKRRRTDTQGSRFQLPTTDLLDPVIGDTGSRNDEQLKETARLLEKTLADYKVEGRVQAISPGPTVTMYEVAPAPGTKVSRVASLADDLALALARKVRIVAPIPGKNRIGFEVPNERRVPVSLRELIESEPFMSMDAPLPCVLGRDIIGHPCFADLSALPHVIIAGSTGAGKSVGLNVMLLSMLFRRTPEELRLLMIDPKVVELAPFDRIPHLLFPVVTDMKQAANALKWAVDEMERRYQLFADAGTRNIVSYNNWAKQVRAGNKPMPPGPKKVDAIAPDGMQVEIPAAQDGSDAEPPKPLPYVVLVVDEYADLMMQQGKDVEASVARLAQKARAAGMHVILATQRPSVDVITGMIKANFPSRIAFKVAQRNDSATILDQQGAEHLLGRGDMLVKLNGTTDIKRVQCPFASEEEVQRVTDYLRTQGEPEYDENIVRARDDDANGEELDPGDAENDPLYDAAVRVVAETRKCSTSWIQRKLGIGYNRAAKIVETMEKRGVVGPALGTKPRDILISPI